MTKTFALKLLFPALTSLLLLVTMNLVVKNFQQQQHDQIARSFLHYSEDVSRYLAAGLDEAVQTGIKDCSEDNIEVLRRIRQQYKYIDDIGLLQNNIIICTANWGRLADKVSMPESFYRTPNGYLLYQLDNENKYIKARQSATVLNDFVIFNSALSYIDVLDTLPEYHLALTTHNQQRVLYDRGETHSKHSYFFEYLFGIETRVCSQIRDLCVVTNKVNGGIMTLPWLLVFLPLVGLIPGILLASSITNFINANKSLENRFIRAIKKNELYMVYQPIVQVSDGRLLAFEALLRWKDGYFGAVSPELFISLAERLGSYPALSAFVMKKSLDEMQIYLTANPGLQLSINIGDEDINDPQYIIRLKEECLKRNIAHQQIKLEITERCQSDYETLSLFCRTVRLFGFIVSLDDFGTGSCNISWLMGLDFDEVKIDKFLVQNIVNSDKQKMLLSIVDGLKITGKRLVFEGVETSSQFDFIHSLNSQFLVQGWYTGKPVTAEKVGILLGNNT